MDHGLRPRQREFFIGFTKGQVIVFCTTGMVTSLLYLLLHEMKMNVREVHSRKPQLYRTRISEEFKESKQLILVTSDVSARGMNYYVTLVIQDVTQAQCLDTESDFRGKDFQRQLKETVDHLLSLKTIPIFNENDAVSTRTDLCEDSSGIFWDNDSLAAILAKELKVDLLILMSDVEGLYSGPPK